MDQQVRIWIGPQYKGVPGGGAGKTGKFEWMVEGVRRCEGVAKTKPDAEAAVLRELDDLVRRGG